MNETMRSQLNKIQTAALIAGATGLVLCAAGAVLRTPDFFHAYLFGYLFWLGLALGCLGLAMIHSLTGGRWGDVTRRFLEAGFMTLPLMAVLFVPIILGLRHIYPWADPAEVALSRPMQSRAAYMNAPGFILRAVVCFAIWIAMAWCLRRWSLRQDKTTDVAPTRHMRTLSGPGIVAYALAITFGYVDWIMSLEPDWDSTIFPVIIWGGQTLAAFALATLCLAWSRKYEPISEVNNTTPFHHLGNLMMTFVLFWTYVTYAQFLIIWAGNLPREIGWYLHRIAGGWLWIIIFLAAFHFFFPFFALLFRATKRHVGALVALAAMLLLAHVAYVFWLIVPSFYPQGVRVQWLDLTTFVGVGGAWAAMFIAELKRGPLLARNDPRAFGELAHAHGR